MHCMTQVPMGLIKFQASWFKFNHLRIVINSVIKFIVDKIDVQYVSFDLLIFQAELHRVSEHSSML